MSFLHREEADQADHWSAVSSVALAGYVAAACLILWLANTGQQWVHVLDSANLAFHEAGHLIYGVLGHRFALYGGTLGQLTFPLLALWVFHRQRKTASFAFAMLWLGENLFNIARYMADARAQVLPLVGGGEHDWTEIFSRWGVLGSDTRIAALVRLMGWAIVVGAAWWLWRRSRGQSEGGRLRMRR